MKETDIRCFITKVLQHAKDWKEFDIDLHCVGAAILWSRKDVQRTKKVEMEKIGTEGQAPVLVDAGSQRKRKQDQWAVNKIKHKVNTGKEHTYVRKGKTVKVPAKALKPSCKAEAEEHVDGNDKGACRKKCSSHISEEERETIFKAYWALGDRYAQWDFIRAHVDSKTPQRRRTRGGVGDPKVKRRSSRNFSTRYHLSVGDRKIEVCQTMFLNTLSISRKVVHNILEKKVSKEGVLKKDSRGRKKGTRLVSERETIVIMHTLLFKCLPSHYARKSSKYQYLPENLTLAEMHRMYQKWCADEGYKPENCDFYRRVFKTRFRLKFHKPKKDNCSTCTAYKNKPVKTQEDEEKQKKHMKDKDLARSLKEERKTEATNDISTTCAAFDLQQVLLSPYGQTSDFYYSRRLKNHNLTITEIDSMTTYCYLWHESEGNKGACEIGTGVFRFLKEKKREGSERIYLFSDACGGQGRNRFVFIMLSYAMRLFGFQLIDLTFLVSGHSQNENDNAHSVIEGHTRNLTIYTPSQWETHIENSFMKNECIMDVITHDMIINLKCKEFFRDYAMVLNDKITVEVDASSNDSPPPRSKTRFHISNFVKGKKKVTKVMWSKIVQIQFRRNDPTKMYFKYEYDKDFMVTEFCTKGSVLQKNKKVVAEPKLYEKPIGVTKKKKEDLMKLCTKGLIPQQHQSFYRDLPVNGKEDDEECVKLIEGRRNVKKTKKKTEKKKR